MSKSIKKNYIYNTSYQILVLIIPFITIPYISRTLTASSIGRFTFVNSILQYFTLFAGMGISIFGQREISYYQDDRKERSRVFWELKFLSLINVTICMIIYLTLVNIYAHQNFKMYMIVSLHIITIVFEAGWFFAGMEEFGLLVSISFVLKILQTACIFIFIKAPNHIDRYAFNIAFFWFLGSALQCCFLPKYIDKPDFKNVRPFRNIKTIWSLFIPTIASSVYSVLDTTMIGLFTDGSYENGYYELCMRVIRIVLMLVTSLAGVMIPRIGYLFKKGDKEQIQRYMYLSYRFIWFIGVPLCLGLIAISDNFVYWFFGEDSARVAELLKISSFLIVVISINSITGSQYLIPTGRQNQYTLSIIIGATVNLFMNIFLIRYFHAYGAVVASVSAEGVIALVELYFVRKELSLIKILLSSRNYLLAGGCMLGILIALGKNWQSSPVNTFTLIFMGAAIYFITLLILRDEFSINNAKKVLQILLRRT